MEIIYGYGSISSSFIKQLEKIYDDGILQLSSGKVTKNGINGYTDFAISAFPITVAIWESFIYETLLSERNLMQNIESSITKIPAEIIDKWSILDKTSIIPDMLYGNSFDKGSKPFQDFAKIVTIRNSLIHYRYNNPSKKLVEAIREMTSRDYFFSGLPEKNDSDPKAKYILIWTHQIATCEAIRWCINTVSEMARILIKLAPENNPIHSGANLLQNFKTISIKEAKLRFKQLGVDSESKY